MKSNQDTPLSLQPKLWLLGLVAVTITTGCSILHPQEDPTRFYVLTVPKAAIVDSANGDLKGLKIGLKPLELPAYLRNKSMVVQTGANEVFFEEFERWAEPLDQGMGRVMKEVLVNALNAASVTLNSHREDALDFEVEIRILACEGIRPEKRASSIRFAATWEIRPLRNSSKPTKKGRFTSESVPWDGTTFSQLAERLSEAIASASTAIAIDLATEPIVLPKEKPQPPAP